jgi:hypothetical protein
MATQKSNSVTRLGEILLSHGVLSLGQLHLALCKQYNTETPFGQVVQDLGLATKSQVEAALTDQAWRRKQRGEQKYGEA